MSQATMKKYPAAFKERAVKLAVDSDQPIAQTARDLGVNENTLHTWIGKYHRTERQEKEVHDEHLYEELGVCSEYVHMPCTRYTHIPNIPRDVASGMLTGVLIAIRYASWSEDETLLQKTPHRRGWYAKAPYRNHRPGLERSYPRLVRACHECQSCQYHAASHCRVVRTRRP